MEQTDGLAGPEVVAGVDYLASEAFEVFVRERSVSLIRFGYTLTGNQHDAADLVQEALIRMGTSWSRVRRKGDPEGYVRTTMVRLHISWWRRRRRERLVEAVPEHMAADERLDHIDARGQLWHALRALAPRRRAVLVLRYYENRTDEEIATILGVSPSTVRSTASRALDRLRAEWAPRPGVGRRTPQEHTHAKTTDRRTP